MEALEIIIPEKKKRVGNRTVAESQAEIAKMRQGVITYVKEQLEAGFEVSEVLLNYVARLEAKKSKK